MLRAGTRSLLRHVATLPAGFSSSIACNEIAVGQKKSSCCKFKRWGGRTFYSERLITLITISIYDTLSCFHKNVNPNMAPSAATNSSVIVAVNNSTATVAAAALVINAAAAVDDDENDSGVWEPIDANGSKTTNENDDEQKKSAPNDHVVSDDDHDDIARLSSRMLL